MPLPFELNHINLWLLEEADGWTLVDTGLNLDDIKRYWEAVLETHCREKPVKRIIVTHCHPDHLGLGTLARRQTRRRHLDHPGRDPQRLRLVSPAAQL
ncbi:MAG: MBL fold metallo-hydrolase [Rhodocyclaceae bacterium]|nr:MBL fold metallo-hydrolase [Rhodocyclaceae bacterium]